MAKKLPNRYIAVNYCNSWLNFSNPVNTYNNIKLSNSNITHHSCSENRFCVGATRARMRPVAPTQKIHASAQADARAGELKRASKR
ncbi:hypothetical protein KDH_14020 [Dictyobacter sp. S3.2.2.5]|uniref:Uncharacterized protein n=1 Tax=Dictyobacter halimunensis TaxID=3026934 RepID=A0ABQ6FPX5_9CHLR|nr:hypothetical protein KDH_14020 [Dictyobacter sp. S3.2.2.5]